MTYEKVHFNPEVAKTMTKKQFVAVNKQATKLSVEQLEEVYDLLIATNLPVKKKK